MPSAQPFFFRNNRYHLYGVLYEPIENVRKEGFVFCDAFAEEKLWSQRVMVAFATLLAKRGYWVLRFDYMGNGESEGDFERSTLSTMISDCRCAVHTLLRTVGSLRKVNVLGLRLGATVAAHAARMEQNIDKLIMWAPLIDGKEYTKELFRINFATQLIAYKRILYNSRDLVEKMKSGETVNVDGYEITYELYSEILSQNLISLSFPEKIAILMCIIGKEKRIDLNQNREQQLKSSWTILNIEEKFFWKDSKYIAQAANELFQKTICWLNGNDH